MKRAARIVWTMVGTIVVLIFLALALCLIPAVQTGLVQAVVKRLPPQISVGHIAVRHLRTLEISNLLLTDPDPFVPTEQQWRDVGMLEAPRITDTVLYVRKAEAIFTLKSLLTKSAPSSVASVEVNDAVFNFVVEPGTTNIGRIFGTAKPKNGGFEGQFVIRAAKASGIRVTMRSYKLPLLPYRHIGVNYNDTDLTLDLLESDGICISEQTVAEIGRLVFHEKTGVRADLNCTLKIHDGHVAVEDIDYTDDYCHTLMPHFSLNWDDPEDWQHFSDSVALRLFVSPSTFSMRTLGQYIDLMPNAQTLFDIHTDCSAVGVWNDFYVSNMHVTDLNSGTELTVNGRILGTDIRAENAFDLHDTEIHSTAAQLLCMVQDFASPALDSIDFGGILETTPLDGLPLSIDIAKATGPLDSLVTAFTVEGGDIGSIRADVTLRHLVDRLPVSFEWKVDADAVNVGKLLKTDQLGIALASMQAEAILDSVPAFKLHDLNIERFDALGYSYSGIEAQGEYVSDRISLKAGSKDPNITFDLDANYSFSRQTSNAVYNIRMPFKADLQALGLDKRQGGSELEGELSLKARYLTQGHYMAGADIAGLCFTDKDGVHEIGDIRLLSDFSNTSNQVTFKAPFASGGYVGGIELTNAIDEVLKLTARQSVPSLFDESKSADNDWCGNTFDLKFTLGDTREILNLIAPDIYVESGTELRASIDKGGVFGATIKSKRVVMESSDAHDICLSITSKDGPTGVVATIGELVLGGSRSTGPVRLEAAAQSDRITLRVDDSLAVVSAKAFRKAESNGFSAKIDKIDLTLANRFCSENLALGGLLHGTAAILFKPGNMPRLGCNIITEDLSFHGMQAGKLSLQASSQGEEIVAKLNLADTIGNASLSCEGHFDPGSELIDANVKLNAFNPGIARSLAPNIISEVDGRLYGSLNAKGTPKHLNLKGKDLRMEDTRIGLVPTGSTYTANGTFKVENGQFEVENLTLTDSYGGLATVSGTIDNARLQLSSFNILDKAYDGNGFYGKLALSGDVFYDGSVGNRITGDIGTSGEGALHAGLEVAGNAETENNTLTFTQKKDEKDTEEFVFIPTKRKEIQKATNLDIDCSLSIGPEVSVWFEIDKNQGNILTGSGAGTVRMKYAGAQDKLDLAGSYVLNNGKYHFSTFNGLVVKDFTINPGSAINFGGGIMDTEFDVEATYSLKTSLAQLISDTTSTVSSRRLVNCGLHISDKLSSPKVGFSIDVPDLDPATKSVVDGELNTEDKIQKQFIALLVSNTFLPSDQAGIINNTNLIYSNLSAMMTGQFNTMLQKLGVPIDVGMNYAQNEVGTDIFDVAISTTLFDDKVTVNGSLGNRKYSTGASDGMVGDIDISVKINKDGTLLMSLFSHSADDYTNYLDNTQRSGIGVAYQKNYNRFFDLFKPRKAAEIVEDEKTRRIEL